MIEAHPIAPQMIEVNEKLVNPIEWLIANVAGPKVHMIEKSVLVSGLDYDLTCMIKPDNEYTKNYVDTTHKDEEISQVFGNLLLSGSGFRRVEGIDGRLSFMWFPSPNAYNELSVGLENQPGIDSFKFVHSRMWHSLTYRDAIPHRHYTSHLALGEYPVSSHHILFSHDRNNDHAVGVLLLPHQIFEYFQTEAVRALFTRGVGRLANKRSISVSDDFDWATSSLGSNAKNYLETGIAHEPIFGSYAVAKSLDLGHFNRRKKLVEVLSAHFDEVFPKIEALKAKHALLQAPNT